MKLFTSSILFTSALLASFLAAEHHEVVEADVRQVSQPMKKTIKRRTDEPLKVEPPKPAAAAEKKGPASAWNAFAGQDDAGEEDDFFKRLTTQMKFDNDWAERRGVKATPPPPPPPAAAAPAGKPNATQQQRQPQQGHASNAEGDDFIKRLTTEMEDFERNWAKRRGVDAPPKPKTDGAAVPPAGTAGAQKPKFNMDDLLGPSSGLKDIVAPLADAVEKDPKLQQNLRQASQQFFKDPASALKEDGPLRKMSEQLFPGLMDKVKPEDLKQMEGLFGGAGGKGGENPFANLFGGTGKGGENPFAGLFGGDKKPVDPVADAATAGDKKKDPFNFDDLFADFLKPSAGKKNPYAGKFNDAPYGGYQQQQQKGKHGAYRAVDWDQVTDTDRSETDFELWVRFCHHVNNYTVN